MNDCITKACTKCKMELPLTNEYFGKDKTKKDGLTSACKLCQRKTCLASYYKHREQRLTYCEAYRAKHKDETREYYRSYARKYHQAHKEQIKSYNKKYRELNPDICKASMKRWQQNNPDKVRAASSRRRAKQKNANGTITAKDIKRAGDLQEWKCWWCLSPCKDKYHIDHRIPLDRGGSNAPNNIVIACPHCNSSKHNKMPDEWAGRLL